MGTPRKTPAAPQEPASDPLADLRGPGEDEARHPGQEPPSEPASAPDEPSELKTVLREALGAASTCWVGGTGDAVFDSEAASKVLDDLLEKLAPLTAAPELVAPVTVEDAVARMHADEVAVGFLHKSFPCGCHYLAELILNGD